MTDFVCYCFSLYRSTNYDLRLPIVPLSIDDRFPSTKRLCYTYSIWVNWISFRCHHIYGCIIEHTLKPRPTNSSLVFIKIDIGTYEKETTTTRDVYYSRKYGYQFQLFVLIWRGFWNQHGTIIRIVFYKLYL